MASTVVHPGPVENLAGSIKKPWVEIKIRLIYIHRERCLLHFAGPVFLVAPPSVTYINSRTHEAFSCFRCPGGPLGIVGGCCETREWQ